MRVWQSTGQSFGVFAVAVATSALHQQSFAQTCQESFLSASTEADQYTLRLNSSLADSSVEKKLRSFLPIVDDIFAQSGTHSKERITSIWVPLDGQELLITQIGPMEFAVRSVATLDQPKFLPPQSIRMSDRSKGSGMNRRHFVSERSLKEQLSEVPSTRVGSYSAAALVDRNGDAVPVFALFRDEAQKHKPGIVRQVIDLTFPREYRLTARNKVAIHSRNGIILETLDEAFESWDGKAYRDQFVNQDGAILPDVESRGPDVFWFLSTDRSERPIRIVFSWPKEAILPFVITAYRPTEAALATLRKLSESQVPTIFDDEAPRSP